MAAQTASHFLFKLVCVRISEFGGLDRDHGKKSISWHFLQFQFLPNGLGAESKREKCLFECSFESVLAAEDLLRVSKVDEDDGASANLTLKTSMGRVRT